MRRSTPPNPYRFVQHFRELRAATLEEAAEGLAELLGPGRETELGEGLVATVFEGEDRYARLFRDGGRLIGIQSGPPQVIQAFFRACSGSAGAITGTGVATGNVFLRAALIAQAEAVALINWGRMLAAVPNPCGAPCAFLPITPPYPSGLSITVVSRFLGIPWKITVTADVTTPMWCV